TSRKSRIFIKDLKDWKSKPVALIDDHNSVNWVIDNKGPVFWVHTDLDAPRGRVVAIELGNAAMENWRELIPQADATLEGVSAVGNRLVCNYLRDARTEIKMYDLAGKFLRELRLPGIGTAGGFGGKLEDTETFCVFTSFTTPSRIYRYDLAKDESTLFREAQVKFNPDDYEVQQVFYKSPDGTKVPMFISHKRGLKLDGTN